MGGLLLGFFVNVSVEIFVHDLDFCHPVDYLIVTNILLSYEIWRKIVNDTMMQLPLVEWVLLEY